MSSPNSWRVEASEPLPRLLRHDADDQLMHICMQLAAELWVVKRRLQEVESQLVGTAVITSPDEIRREPDYRFDTQARDRFVRSVLGVLLDAPE